MRPDLRGFRAMRHARQRTPTPLARSSRAVPAGLARPGLGLWLGLAAGHIGLASACSPGAEPPAEPPPDVVVILMDTLRPDHLPIHGYGRETAPFLSELRARSTLFRRAYSSSSVTPPSVASLFTGVYPREHGLFEVLNARKQRVLARLASGERYEAEPTQRLPQDLPSLPEILRAGGYRTFAVFSNPNVTDHLGFERGFDRWIYVSGNAPGADEVLAGLASLEPEIGTASPRFVYLHFMDPHYPYQPRDPEQPLAPRPPGQVPASDNYDREIRYLDRHLRTLFERLHLRERTLVVFASDHGEELRERGRIGHARGLYAELNRVLLMIHAPYLEHAPPSVAANVSLIDVLPTILEATGLATDGNLDGTSLWPLLTGEEPAASERRAELEARTLYADRRRRQAVGPPHAVWSAIEGDWRLIADHSDPDAPRRMLFDHGRDPAETTDVSAQHPDVVDALDARIETYRDHPTTRWERQRIELSEDDRATLEAIGYVEP